MADSGQFKKYIAEQKLKAFSIGAMGKTQPSKKELNEQKKKEEEHAAAQAFEEFVATFQNEGKKNSKVWVKAGTYDAGKRQEDTREKGKLYKPQARGNTDSDKADDLSRFMGERKSERMLTKKKKEGEKKKSNLELFKEELKMIQEEREERHKFKGVLQKTIEDPEIKSNLIMVEPDEIKGSFDSGDPNTTNLYLGNLNPKITEAQLMEVFGKYGPLASIKIMWPRSDEEKARGRNCGFVAYMSRKDGERALKNLNGKDVMSYEMKMGWGKSVPIPPHPIFIPPALLAITLPPPLSGLPFNAQPILPPKEKKNHGRARQDAGYFDRGQPVEKILPQTIIKVVIPTERNLLMLIHHMIEFVIREGPLFEAMIMNKELNNPMFQFLFDNCSPTHIYYRWKLFSMLQGDSTKDWRIDEFRMFKNGSIWRPPPMNPYTVGMPEELVPEEDLVTRTKGTLSISQRERFEDLIRNMTPERLKVAEVMVFCVEHSDAVEEICDCIQESLSNATTALHKKIARLYLISDVLHNCSLKVINATQFRRGFETRLIPIMEEALKTYKSLDSQSQADGFKHRIMQIFRAWEDWDIYPKEFLFRCQNTFLGLSINDIPQELINSREELQYNTNSKSIDESENIDGAPLSEPENLDNEDLDGIPLDGATLLKHAYDDTPPGDTDIDGTPLLDDDIGGVPLTGEAVGKNIKAAAFVPSRWETVDPHEAEEQAMTTSKWEMLERENKSYNSESVDQDSPDDDFNETRENADDRRAKLREVEVKVMQYQDELESGKRALKGGWNIYQQVEHYRRKLLKKVQKSPEKELKLEKEKKDKDKINKRLSPDEDYRDGKKKKRSRSPSNSPAYSKWSSHSIRSDSLSPPSRKRPNSPQRNNKKTRISPIDSPRSLSRRRDRDRDERHNYRHKRSHSRSPHRHHVRTPPTPLSHTSRKHKHKY
ncbi:U2 snRNP-associated SURP motif-containing protein isoform X1 [Acyrthosiphon pisum]|uniref:U2 snRNP-associated SURP motif-containing protein n=1 Tax=Acyrthosiphon pisum TaxID=7029 RepID=A0A8R1WXX4_ACYPI|nr:U2 snRNP-associated SURP motif-containing protein isoform X1 [Acyrthosiphon pisum]|eukprot:XP_008178793.1 PREDICTED: U2 snRNP-associated SURP motif-containing protein isoform X1 [Acyrthosiphon pisum]